MFKSLFLTIIFICAVTAISAQTENKVAVLMFNFPSTPSQPYTVDEVRNILYYNNRAVNKFYKEVSFNKFGIRGAIVPDGDIFGWYTLSNDPSGTCDINSWYGEVEARAAEQGFVRSNYDHIIYMSATYPSVCTAVWPTGAFGKNMRIWGNVFNETLAAHELGHMIGKQHSNGLRCTLNGVPVSIGGTCTSDEYDDEIDIMGGGRGHFNTYQKLEWLDPQNIFTISSNTQAGDYTIYPLEVPSSGIQALRILRNRGEYFYVEFRRPIGFDSNIGETSSTNGATIHTAPIGEGGKPNMLSMNPPDLSIHGVGLTEGSTFTDSAYGINITTLGFDRDSNNKPTAVRVRVSFDSSACVKTKPSISFSPNLMVGTAGQSLNYNMEISNNNIVACPAATYALTASLPAKWTQTPVFQETIPSSTTIFRVITITSVSGSRPKDYSINEKVFDTSNTKLSNTYPITYRIQ